MKFPANVFRCLTVLLCVFSTLGCSSPIKKKIVGKWTGVENGSVEYFRDGTIKMTGPGLAGEIMTIPGKYTFLDENTLKLDMNVFEKTISQVCHVKIENDILIVIDEEGKRTTSSRINE